MSRVKASLRAVAAAGTCLLTLVTVPVTAQAAGTSGHDPSGQRVPAGDLPGWKQIFADDFSTAVPTGQFPHAVSDKWSAYPAGWFDTSKNGAYAPGKVVSVHDGLMDLHLRTENGQPLVSAPVPKLHGPGAEGGLLYGRYAVRFKADRIPYYKTAWLLWPDSEKWADGEIDFPEGNLDQRISAFMHHVDKPTSQHAFNTAATFTTWHTAVTEWTPDHVRFILDGVTIGLVTDKTKIPRTPMHWVLQTETSLSGGRPKPSISGHVYIDWVAAYAYTGR